jgi:hypothetical protein
VEAQAEVQAQAACAEARRRIERAAREDGILLSGLRMRLAYPDPASGALVLAQANAHADGHPIRVQTAAPTPGQALDDLLARTRARLEQTLHAWAPRPWPETARQPPAAPAGTHASITRVKTCRLIVCPAQVAAAYMDAMDYDTHLFTDQESGHSAAVRRAGPTGYRLTRLRPAAPPRQTRLPLVIDPRPAPQLTTNAAAARLEATGAAHLFFADPTTGHGYLIYRRYDGHFTLLTGDPDTANAARSDTQR